MSTLPIYTPPFFLFNAHLETVYPSLLRRVSSRPYVRERITTPDDDFLDLDWIKTGSSKVMIISHGLEGNSERAYVRGMARAGYENGFDVLAWNFRGCSGEVNRQLRFYHSGATDDLDVIVEHARKSYAEIYLVGFSLGGNLTLKYLGERQVKPEVKKAAVFSVPMNLGTSCDKIAEASNWIYQRRFLKSLVQKVVQKSPYFKELDTKGIQVLKTLRDFDDRYTAPLHGFNDAAHYYEKCSSIHFVDNIQIPTLIVNAANDPFLSRDCYPADQLRTHKHVVFESPDFGGHVGFSQFSKNGLYWSEERALKFLLNDIPL
jgi:predicted alpha/beta-fold hydrolase